MLDTYAESKTKQFGLAIPCPFEFWDLQHLEHTNGWLF
jgi:hypothetical protein